jgi:hypothetical protein
MLTASQEREQNAAAAEVFARMRKNKLTLADLTDIGGEDLKSPEPKLVEKARAVGRTWALIARIGLTYVELETLLPALDASPVGD